MALEGGSMPIPLWQSAINRFMESNMNLFVVFHWTDSKLTERIVRPNDDVSFIGNCIREHGDQSPHVGGIAKLKEVTVQFPVGEKGEWGRKFRIWPDNRLAQIPRSF